MRAFWALLIAATVFGFAGLRTHHVRRTHPLATLSAAAVGHHHHARTHRISATIVERPSIDPRERVVVEPRLAPVIEAPIAPVDAPVARGPPRA